MLVGFVEAVAAAHPESRALLTFGRWGRYVRENWRAVKVSGMWTHNVTPL
jgi:hypothetical protein